jgi:hypothetical protein
MNETDQHERRERSCYYKLSYAAAVLIVCFAWRSAAAATSMLRSHVVFSHRATQKSYGAMREARSGDD